MLKWGLVSSLDFSLLVLEHSGQESCLGAAVIINHPIRQGFGLVLLYLLHPGFLVGFEYLLFLQGFQKLFLVEDHCLLLEFYALKYLVLALALQLFADSLFRVVLYRHIAHVTFQNLKEDFLLTRNVVVLTRVSEIQQHEVLLIRILLIQSNFFWR